MRGKCLFVLGTLACFCVSSRAGDADNVMRQCESTASCIHEDVGVTLERHRGRWSVTAIDVSCRRLAESDFALLAVFTTLDSLSVSSIEESPAEGIRALAALPCLRQLTLRGNLHNKLKAASTLPTLEQLTLGRMEPSGGEDEGDRALKYLSKLPGLQSLDLGPWTLDDELMEYIGTLKSLQELRCQFSKDVSAAGLAKIKGLSKLRSLGHPRIDADGLLALKDLRKLEHLTVSIPYESESEDLNFSALGSLEQLDICFVGDPARGKNFRLRIPEKLRGLALSRETAARLRFPSSQHIERISVFIGPSGRYNEQTERFDKSVDLKWLGSFPKLRDLELREPVDKDVEVIARTTCPRALTVVGGSCGDVSIGDPGMKAIGAMRQLESLKVENGWNVTDAGMASLSNLGQLQRLELLTFSAKLTAVGLAPVWQLKHLRTLAFAAFDSTADEGFIANVRGLPDLEELTFSGRATDEELQNLAALKKLRRLDLSQAAGFTNGGISWMLKSLPNLDTLKITVRFTPTTEQREN